MTFTAKPAVRTAVPLLFGIAGPSSSGKTWSALEIGTGMLEVRGGEMLVLDSESKRALHYADKFKFQHAEFNEPFGSDRYLEAIKWAVEEQKASVVIVDSCSHEHEGPGGYLDFHERELDRLAGEDFGKRQAMNMLAWAKPSQRRRDFIGGLTRLNACFIMCFRAKEKIKMDPKAQRREDKIIDQGWMPIAGPELVYEMTAQALLEPGSKGVPNWTPEQAASRSMVKLPDQFTSLFVSGEALHRKHGRAMAQWAAGVEPNKNVRSGTAREAPSDEQATQSAAHPTPTESLWSLVDANGRVHEMPLAKWQETLVNVMETRPYDRAQETFRANRDYLESMYADGFDVEEAARKVEGAWLARQRQAKTAAQ